MRILTGFCFGIYIVGLFEDKSLNLELLETTIGPVMAEIRPICAERFLKITLNESKFSKFASIRNEY